MNTEKATKIIFFLSVLPLIFALFLSLYFSFNLADLTTITYKFSRINSYIYAHSYGAILLTMFCGLCLGRLINEEVSGWILLIYFILVMAAWLSYQSFADWIGMSFLIFCWIVHAFLFIKARNLIGLPGWFNQGYIKVQIIIILLLSLITLINQ